MAADGHLGYTKMANFAIGLPIDVTSDSRLGFPAELRVLPWGGLHMRVNLASARLSCCRRVLVRVTVSHAVHMVQSSATWGVKGPLCGLFSGKASGVATPSSFSSYCTISYHVLVTYTHVSHSFNPIQHVAVNKLIHTVIVWRSEGVFRDRPTRWKYYKITDCNTRTYWLTRQNCEYRRILDAMQHQHYSVLAVQYEYQQWRQLSILRSWWNKQLNHADSIHQSKRSEPSNFIIKCSLVQAYPNISSSSTLLSCP